MTEKSILIVTENRSYGVAVQQVLIAVTGVKQVKVVSHREVAQEFMAVNPTHTMVCEYEDVDSGSRFYQAHETWQELKKLAQPEQILFRSGFSDIAEEDFLRQPISLPVLIDKLTSAQ